MKHHEPHEPRIAKSEGHKTTNYNQQMSGDAPFENYWLVCCIPRRAIPICDDILISHLIRTPQVLGWIYVPLFFHGCLPEENTGMRVDVPT